MSMEVVVHDAKITVEPGASGWSWKVAAWEYLGLTIIPISSNGDVRITGQWVISDPSSNRLLQFNVLNNTSNRLDCFVTVTLPAKSVT